VPLYEYECASCRKRFEIRQKVTEDSLTDCPSCGGVVRRVIHPVGIIFKGSGFYVTDNRKTEAPSSTTGTEDAAAPSKESDGAKVESGAKTEAGAKAESGSRSDSKADSSSKSDSHSKPAAASSGNNGSASSDSSRKSSADKNPATS